MDYRKPFRVKPGKKLKLSKLDPAYKGKHNSDAAAKEETERYIKKLARQQTLLYAERKHSRPRRPAGDGRRREGRHDQACVQQRQSARRECRQLQTADAGRTRARFSLARPPARAGSRARSRSSTARTTRTCWSRGSTSSSTRHLDRALPAHSRLRGAAGGNGTTILKFFLHISKDEQLGRFAQRLDDPGRNWKISESDYSEREFWDDYMEAYEDAIAATSTHRGAVVHDSLRITSGSAISPCRRSWPTRSRISTSHSRRRRPTLRTCGANIIPRSSRPRAGRKA